MSEVYRTGGGRSYGRRKIAVPWHSYTRAGDLWEIKGRLRLKPTDLQVHEMRKDRSSANAAWRVLGLAIALTWVWSMAGCQVDLPNVAQTGSGTAASAQEQGGLVIENDSDLPDTYPHANYELRFRAHGHYGGIHWHLEKGAIPPGLKLEEDGLLHGQPERTGEFEFTLAAWEGGRKDEAVEKGFTLRVHSALVLNWKKYAEVRGNRIDGSAEVTNTTPDDVDLTFIAVALPPNGRAVAIGYQHFVLPRGTIGKELPFGDTLPHGGYVVRLDAVGEVAAKKEIYREFLQTPDQLHIAVGP